jgi:hypothetical protein
MMHLVLSELRWPRAGARARGRGVGGRRNGPDTAGYGQPARF